MAEPAEADTDGQATAERFAPARAAIESTFETLTERVAAVRRALAPLRSAGGESERAAELVAVLQSGRRRLSTFVQSGDAAAQRLAHIEVALARLAERPPTEREAVLSVAGMQMRGLAEDILDGLLEAEGALVEMVSALRELEVEAAGDLETGVLEAALSAVRSDAMGPLADAARALVSAAPAPITLSPTPALDWLLDLYTMEAERVLHARAFETAAPELYEQAVSDGARDEPEPAPMPAEAEQCVRGYADGLVSHDPRRRFARVLVYGSVVTPAILAAVSYLPGGEKLGTYALIVAGHALLVWGLATALHRRTIDRLIEIAERMERLAYRDTQTGLLNKRGMSRLLGRALDAADRRPVSVLHIDLDHFKAVNDTLGHAAGDHVLAVTAERVRSVIAATVPSAEPCRIGGDEFCVLVFGGDDGMRNALACGIVEAVRQPIDFEGNACGIGASIGIATSPLDGRIHPERLLSDADLATYAAKAEGRGRYVIFDAAMRAEQEREADLVRALRRALAERRLELWFQPVTDPDQRRVLAAEALLRWNDDALQAAGAEEILGVASRSGLADQMNAAILARLSDLLAQWRSTGIVLPLVTFNLDANELRLPGLHDRVVDAFGADLVGLGTVGVEVTESAIAGRGSEIAERNLTQLTEAGSMVVLDRFGRDQVSLAALARLPLASVKLDRTLVSELGVKADNRGLLRGLVSVARTLSLDVTAVGVETREQLALLREVGCDAVQGHAIAPAMAPATFREWLNFMDVETSEGMRRQAG